jgi:hypothetical protein
VVARGVDAEVFQNRRCFWVAGTSPAMTFKKVRG